MSYVSDFLINPILRQARRFSQSQQLGEQVGQQPNTQYSHETSIENISHRLDSLNRPDDRGFEAEASISGEALTSSPIEENGGLEAELDALALPLATIPIALPSQALSSRVDSLRSNAGQIDDDVSDNPMFGIPGRFRTNSGTSYTEHNVTGARMSPAEGPSRSSTLDFSQTVESARRHRNSSLPADDGMGALRHQIVTIQAMEAPAEQKAQMMHQLLTRGYTQSQERHNPRTPVQVPSTANMISQERPTTPGSLASYLWQMNGTDDVPSSEQHTFHLSPEDLEPTYAPLDPPEADEDGALRYREDELQALGCRHYKRNVKLQCSTCDRWYTCRLCHDEVENHILIRQATQYMLCMLCGCAQRAGEDCARCGERTAWYYCGVCKLWDNDPNKNIYHCSDCGICRKGRGLGKDFFHCKTCGVCMEMAYEHSHKCIERVSDCDCPICGEYMFTSPRPVVFMLCGHSIHQQCYYEHMKSSYKCPICSKSTVNMETQFRNLDRAIDSQPMPPQFRDTKAMVSCNDCYAKSAVKYHWLGLKCAICDSYNTAQLSILSDPAVEVPAIDSRELENPSSTSYIIGDGTPSMFIGTGPLRIRRHSSHMYTPRTSNEEYNRFSPYPLPARLGRSVSPVRGLGLCDSSADPSVETDDSVIRDDELDFWGRDELRSLTSAELLDSEIEMDLSGGGYSDDSASLVDDCDEGDDEDEFELLGHR